jgi:hypothetical protein
MLGENLVIPTALTQGVSAFYLINAVCFLLCFFSFYAFMHYMRRRKLI